jgi:sulfopyruvate decarboxylase subunit beta
VIDLHDALSAVHRIRRGEDVVITTMAAARAWMELGGGPHPLDLVFVPSSMSQATSFGLGIALAQPARRVIVFNGDGSMLMNLGSLVTIAAQAPPNLVVILLDNGVYEVTGAQPVPGRVDFIAMARASGFSNTHQYRTLPEWTANVDRVLGGPGPVFARLDIQPVVGRAGPRSPGPAAPRAKAFMAALGVAR